MFYNIKSKKCLGHSITDDGCEILLGFPEQAAKYRSPAIACKCPCWLGVIETSPVYSQSHTNPGCLFRLSEKCQQSQWPHEKCSKCQTVFFIL